MELNRERIIKAMECCGTGTVDDCGKCPYCNGENISTEDCMERLIKYALSLIKELTEENERLKAENTTYANHVEEVAENYYKVGKADAVRKMQERLRVKGFHHINFGYIVYGDDIDQIAEEIIGEKNGT